MRFKNKFIWYTTLIIVAISCGRKIRQLAILKYPLESYHKGKTLLKLILRWSNQKQYFFIGSWPVLIIDSTIDLIRRKNNERQMGNSEASVYNCRKVVYIFSFCGEWYSLFGKKRKTFNDGLYSVFLSIKFYCWIFDLVRVCISHFDQVFVDPYKV